MLPSSQESEHVSLLCSVRGPWEASLGGGEHDVGGGERMKPPERSQVSIQVLGMKGV